MQSPTYESWMQGPPQRMRDPKTISFIERMHKAFPISRIHRDALNEMGSDFTFARRMDDGSWEALVALNSGIAGRLGVTGNVAVLYLPYRDLFDNVLKRVHGLQFPRKTEEHFCLLFSEDPRQSEKIADWTLKSPVRIVGMPRDGRAREQAAVLFTNMLGTLSNRNAYEVSNAVTGDDFFGRQRIIQDLTRDMQDGYVAGIFGLRKVGKTSIMKEVMHRFETVSNDELRVVAAVEDLEDLPNALEQKVPRLCSSLASTLQNDFKRLGLRTHELSRITEGSARGEPVQPARLRDAIHASLDHKTAEDAVVVLGLDEVESLITPSSEDEDAPEVAEFLGSLRSLSQEHDSFKVMLAGITAAPFRQGVIYGRENPLFSWAKPVYVGPLARDEADTMTIRLGRRMAVHWNGDALSDLYEVTSGHAFLHRNFAGSVVQSLLDSEFDHIHGHTVRSNDVRNQLRAWRREAAEIVDNMLRALERYYPAGWAALEFLREGLSLDDIEDYDPSAVATLINLGVLEDSRGVLGIRPWVRISSLLRGV